MLRADEIDALREYAAALAEPIEDFLIEDIARRIANAGGLTSTAAEQIRTAQRLGMSRTQIERAVRRRLEVTKRKTRELMRQAAEQSARSPLQNASRAAVPFEQNAELQQIVDAAYRMTEGELDNLTRTLGFVAPNGNTLPLSQSYRRSADEAMRLVASGAADYQTAIRRATKQLADQGIQVIDYESGVHTSLEAAVRRSVMGGLGLMQEQISQRQHDAFGCNGWEISAHANSAPDHEPIQGRQYSDAAYQQLNDSLQRRIGTLNCGHVAFPIILGVDAPQYTPEELERFRSENEKGITYRGQHFTGYEATQHQRALERAARRQKRRILADKATGDDEKLLEDRIRLRRIDEEYTRFSDAAGLRTQRERMHVAEFGNGEAKETIAAVLEFEKTEEAVKALPGATEATARPAGRALKDVTQEYIDSATPDVGIVEHDEGYNLLLHSEEIQFAKWIHRSLGGDIRLLIESEELNVKSPDYLWRGKLWDLKTVTTAKAANTAIKRGVRQIIKNPGGVMLDYTDHVPEMNELKGVIEKRMQWYPGLKIDIMVVQDQRLIAVFRK